MLHHNNNIPACISTNEPLNNKNWFGTGGNARFFAEPQTFTDIKDVLAWAQMLNVSLYVLGQGANILVSDDGFDGLIIRPNIQHLRISESNGIPLVTAGAGVTMDALINYCLEHNLTGLEEFSGIPGTVGGSVYINLHYFEFLLAQFLVSARVINRATGMMIEVPNEWFNFGYNTSRLLDATWILYDATFACTSASTVDVAYARGRRAEIIRHRVRRYPSQGTCGSFFRNFYPEEVNLSINGQKMIHVAYYLDKLGLKGNYTVGDATISWQHANMLVNTGAATTADIIAVARHMQTTVYNAYSIIPQPECRLIGFTNYPLLS